MVKKSVIITLLALLLESEKREISDCLHNKKQSEFDWDIIRIYIAIVVFVLLFIIAMMV
jgi:hypothetical protein